MRGAKDANTRLQTNRNWVILGGGIRESGLVGERKGWSRDEVGAKREREVGGVAGGDAEEERKAKDGEWKLGSNERILMMISFFSKFHR